MSITQKYLINNECYKANKNLTPTLLMVHSTACPGVRSDNFINSWNTARPNGREVCVHAFIDDTGIYQTLPWNIQAWHCGGNGNQKAIGIELCEPSDYTDRAYFEKVKNNAISAYAYLCLTYALSPVNIISHKEGCSMGIASNHGDPDHWWKHVGYTMDDFRNDVQNYLNVFSGQSQPSVVKPEPKPENDYIDNIHYAVGTVCRKDMLPEVTNWNDWAGIYGEAIDRFAAHCDNTSICYRGWINGKWSDWVYAGGILGTKGLPISLIQISAAGKFVTYNAHLCGKPESEWQGFISGWDANDKNTGGRRGWLGMAIDGLICVVKYPK